MESGCIGWNHDREMSGAREMGGKGGGRKKNRSEEWKNGLNRRAVGDSVI
jgi:hypothetical protein